MIEAFEAHYGQTFTDKDWRNETSIWAAAWGYAVRRCNVVPTAPAPMTSTEILNCDAHPHSMFDTERVDFAHAIEQHPGIGIKP